jgi:putative FmdB family regulatory protein
VPLYEYKCLKCNRRTEKIEPVNGPHLKKCPHCGGKMEALISASAIQFKGSGWYVTDYAGKKAGSSSSSSDSDSKDEKSASDKKDSASKDSARDSGKDSGSKETSTKETKETKDTKEKKSEKSAKK